MQRTCPAPNEVNLIHFRIGDGFMLNQNLINASAYSASVSANNPLLLPNTFHNADCMDIMRQMRSNSVTMTLVDIPYNECNRKHGSLRSLDKGMADILTFDLQEFLSEVTRVTSGTAIIFCGRKQYSEIDTFFSGQNGTVRQLIWEKTNPSPMNGKLIYLSGIENAVWFRKSGAVFNAHCKNTVFRYPVVGGKLRKLHPTIKPLALMEELISDNSNASDIVFDPCAGSGSTLLAARNLGRQYLGVELNEDYYSIAVNRLAQPEPTPKRSRKGRA